MTLAADRGRHSGRATPSLHDGPYRQFKTATGGRSTYPLPNPVQTNPATSLYKMQSHAYKYSWALVPISVPFLWLLFPFSRRFHLYDHTVFVTYSLSFMTLLFSAGMIAGALGVEPLGALMTLVPPIHMYKQLRGAYGVSRVGALLRTVGLLIFASTALVIYLVAIAAEAGSG